MTEILLGDARFRNSEDAEDASLDPYAGGTAYGKPIWDKDEIAAYLNRTGGQWGNGINDLLQRGGDVGVITFGFHENQRACSITAMCFANGKALRVR